MKKLLLLIASLSFLPSSWVMANTDLDFTCPVAVDNPSLKQMTDVMRISSIWTSGGGSGIVFVDELHELYVNQDTTGPLTPIGESFIYDGSAEPFFTGSFKINYEYQATECRRQVVLTGPATINQLTGVYKGETFIEICAPDLMKAFADINSKIRQAQLDATGQVQGTDFMKDIYPVFLKQAEALDKQYQEEQKKVDELYDIAYEVENQANELRQSDVCKDSSAPNYDTSCLLPWARLKLDAENKMEEAQRISDEVYALSDRAWSLRGLAIPNVTNSDGEPAVRYLKDKEGFVLPRFAVTLEQFFYTRIKDEIYDPQTGDYKEDKGCMMNIHHATNYAGLAQTYNWSQSYQTPMTANVWTFDDQGQTVVSPRVYTTDEDGDGKIDYNFLDFNEHFDDRW